MHLGSTLTVSFRALRRNPMRSLLTALGIIIGVGAVIAMVSIGNGAKSMVEAQIASLGENVLLVFSGSFNQGGARSGAFGAGTLTVDDAEAIRREVSTVVAVSPEVRTGAQVLANGLNWSTQILGEGPDYLAIRAWPLSEGAMFTDGDVRSVGKVCIIGQTIATQLFPDGSPVGQTLRIRSQPFKVVGVLSAKGLSVQGADQDDLVIVPYSSAMKRVTKQTMLRSISVQATSAETLDLAQNDIIGLLRQRHRTTEQTDDFTVRSQVEIAQAEFEKGTVTDGTGYGLGGDKLGKIPRHEDAEHYRVLDGRVGYNTPIDLGPECLYDMYEIGKLGHYSLHRYSITSARPRGSGGPEPSRARLAAGGLKKNRP